MAVYKEDEFRAFIEAIEQGQQCHWVDMARALNVDKNTLTAWKSTPEAKQAISKGIERALQCMEQAGARDWRMWREKLKMLGLSDSPQIVLSESHNPAQDILKSYGLLDEE